VGSAETPLGFSSRFLLQFVVGQGFFPYTNILRPATVGTTVGLFGKGPVLHVVKSSTESMLHYDHRIGLLELKDTEQFLLRCCHSETHAANAVSGRLD
jgi:hypothetical protein